MDRFWLLGSTFCFLVSFGYTLFALRAGRFLPSRFNFLAVAAGFVLQTVFLYLRGEAIGRCPLTNLFEVFVFVSWSMTLIYMIVGPAYRLSLMGAFTSPVVFFIQALAFVLPIDQPSAPKGPPNAWVEFHASFSIIACGAFLLAGVAGVMYLVQDRQLKRHTLGSLFYRLPPISHLAIANRRLVFLGFVLLTLGLGAGFFIHPLPGLVKLGLATLVWVMYFAILWGRGWKVLPPHRLATASVVAFAVVIGVLWGVTLLSGGSPR
ncbi:MAG TPA: cytochrome c biogenesis protein CcsA [Chthoniobacterales bacterium]